MYGNRLMTKSSVIEEIDMDKVLLYRRKDEEMIVYIYGYLKQGQLEVMVAFVEKKWNDEISRSFGYFDWMIRVSLIRIDQKTFRKI